MLLLGALACLPGCWETAEVSASPAERRPPTAASDAAPLLPPRSGTSLGYGSGKKDGGPAVGIDDDTIVEEEEEEASGAGGAAVPATA